MKIERFAEELVRAFSQTFFLNLHRLLADETTEVVHASAHDFGLLVHFDLGNERAVDREDFFDAFAIGNTTDRECFVDPRTLASDYDTSENLDTLFAAFDNARVYLNAIAYLKWWHIRLNIVLCQFFDEILVHLSNPLINLVAVAVFVPVSAVAAISRFRRDFRRVKPLELAYFESLLAS